MRQSWWRPVAVAVLLAVAVAATVGAVSAERAGQESVAVGRALGALLAFTCAWILVLPAALR